MHIFDRHGEVAAIQDKQHFYWKERSWFKRGSDVRVFEVDGVKIGLVRGLDILYPEYTQRLREAEIVFFSTMAMDDMMFDLAKTRTLEDQCYVEMDFVGNAAIIEPVFVIRKGMKTSNQTRVLQHTTEEGYIQMEWISNVSEKSKRDGNSVANFVCSASPRSAT